MGSGFASLVHADASAVAPPARSAVESEGFGLELGRLTVARRPRYGPEVVGQVVGASDLDVVVLRLPGDAVGWSLVIEEASGYQAVLADCRTYLTASAPFTARTADGDPMLLATISPDDEAGWVAVDALLARSDGARSTHYAANPLLAPTATAAVYGARLREMAARADTPSTVALWSAKVDAEPEAVVAFGEVEGADMLVDVELLLLASSNVPDVLLRLILAVEQLAVDRGAARVAFAASGHDLETFRVLDHLGYRPVLAATTLHLVRPELLVG